jgi:putative aldouronate transport system permease protein
MVAENKHLRRGRPAYALHRSGGDKIFDTANYMLMVILLVLVVYPLYFVVIASISDPFAVQRGEALLVPRDITMAGYEAVFESRDIWTGYRNSILYTVVGTSINLLVTLTCGYALATRNLPFGRAITLAIVFTMLFDGGIVPRYLIVKELGMLNTIWALTLPRAAWVFAIMITRTFIRETIPPELYEAAQVEGVTFARYFFFVVLPLSPALISILVLLYGVGHWNSFFDALIYLDRAELFPLQLVLRNILISNQMSAGFSDVDPEVLRELLKRAETIKYAVIIVASIPVLILYPFLQKYFVKGIMIGAIKG